MKRYVPVKALLEHIDAPNDWAIIIEGCGDRRKPFFDVLK